MDPSKCHKTGPDYDPAECQECLYWVDIWVWATNDEKLICFERGDCKNLYCTAWSSAPVNYSHGFWITHEDAIRSFAEHGARFCESPLDAAGSEE